MNRPSPQPAAGEIQEAQVRIDPGTGNLDGEDVTTIRRSLADLSGVFEDEPAYRAMPGQTPVYRVQAHLSVTEGTRGGLYFGTSFIEPGRVGDEYFMTKGHFHSVRDTAEYYWGIAGRGCLILMDEARRTWAQWVRPGSLHYIPGRVAHRLANTGDQTLVVGACWPSDASHDYASLASQGFSARLKCIDGRPQLQPCART